jgi:hypothetical protein
LLHLFLNYTYQEWPRQASFLGFRERSNLK